MTRKVFVVAVVATLACSDAFSSDLLSPTEINGAWDFDVVRTVENPGTFCSDGGRIVADFDFPDEEDSSRWTNEFGSMTSRWSNDASDPDRYPLTGEINYVNGEIELRFWSSTGRSGWMLLGEIRDNLTFSGELIDPIPGYGSSTFAGCSYTVTGRKR